MKAIGMGVAVVLAALAIAPAAFADGSGGPGGAQAGVQAASTAQGALGVALSHQNAVNANVPVSIAGGNITSGRARPHRRPLRTRTLTSRTRPRPIRIRR